MKKDQKIVLKCPCGDIHPDGGACFFVDGRTILEPVTEFILSKVSFPELAESVIDYLKLESQQSQKIEISYRQQRQKLKAEIENLINFISQSSNLSTQVMTTLQDKLEAKTADLRSLELKANHTTSKNSFLKREDCNIIKEFLMDMRTEWDNIPPSFQAMFFKLILDKIFVQVLSDENFLVDIHWRTDFVDTLWVERPLEYMPRKPWTDEQKGLLKKLYPTSDWKTIVAAYPGKTRDSIREQAHRLGLKRVSEIERGWENGEDETLVDFANGVITYKEMRYQLRHRRMKDLLQRTKRLGFEIPDVTKVNWRLVNTSQNEVFSPE